MSCDQSVMPLMVHAGFIVQADLTRPEAIGAVVDRARTEFGTLDIFVSNARPELLMDPVFPLEIH